MKNLKFILEITALLAILGGVLAFKYLRGDEYKIKKQLQGLCEDLQKNTDEGNAATALKMVAFGNRLDNHVRLSIHDIPLSGEFSGEELVGHASRARLLLQKIQINILGQEITIDGDTANVECVVDAKALGKNYDYLDDEYCLRITLRKDDGGRWLFTEFKENEVLVR